MLWVVLDEADDYCGCLVIHVMPQRDSLMVWLMGGTDFDAWHQDVQGLLQRYAREHALSKVEAYVRPGLSRKLRKSGWRTANVLVALDAEIRV